ncbi:hypothetical protein HPB50_013652 [Hyalomma asiaticum]|uniref:Uncharacterized protein n=1 Tax=Hyalomma asiaticum TaxID=266040 RepID=A0ACB7THM1_HYAAI|nr:hypothetical protein HPB50_013652 [Hyalomma asiaticum]
MNKGRLINASRMPQLPEGHYKVVIRSRGGLNLSKVKTSNIVEAVIEAIGLTRETADGDVTCPNNTQNIIVQRALALSFAVERQSGAAALSAEEEEPVRSKCQRVRIEEPANEANTGASTRADKVKGKAKMRQSEATALTHVPDGSNAN